jgi:hypothetical protein
MTGIWGLGLYEDWGYMRTGVIWRLGWYEDWDYMRTGVIWGLGLYIEVVWGLGTVILRGLYHLIDNKCNKYNTTKSKKLYTHKNKIKHLYASRIRNLRFGRGKPIKSGEDDSSRTDSTSSFCIYERNAVSWVVIKQKSIQ